MDSLRIRGAILERMLAHARAESPLECCGLLAGHGRVITGTYPAKNSLASTTAYEIAPAELFRIFREMRAKGLEHLGIYHSHPHSENAPSPTDIQSAFYPETPYLIISPQAGAERPVRAFLIRGAVVSELQILVE